MMSGDVVQGFATSLGPRVTKAFWKAIEHNEAEAVEDHRALELARLDALRVPLWDKAMSGDAKAAGMVLKIIEARSRLLGLDKQGFGQGAQTVVLSPAESAAWRETPGADMEPCMPAGFRRIDAGPRRGAVLKSRACRLGDAVEEVTAVH